jgi:hypothetical protein
MSMWLNLAKVSPALLTEIRADPALLDRLFFEDDAGLPDGVTARTDIFGCDYRTLIAVAEAKAVDGGADGSDWNDTQPWLARATGDDTENLIEEYEFTYGPAYFLEADEVRAVHDGLVAEGWVFPEDLLDEDTLGEDGDEPDAGQSATGPADEGDEEDSEYEYDDFVDLVPFLAAAVREGKAVVGGVG